MKKSIYISIILIISISIFANWDSEWYNTNEFVIDISNYGVFGCNVSSTGGGAYWPSEYTTETYIYGGGLWVGGLIDTNNNYYDTLEVAFLKEDLLQKEILIADLTETIQKKDKLTDMIEDLHSAIMECGVKLEKENPKDQLNLFY